MTQLNFDLKTVNASKTIFNDKMLLFILTLFIFGCSIVKSKHPQSSSKLPLAFPGAEGFGKYTTGGRGGKVIIVSNLNDKGPGSFREAASFKFPRIIVFSIAGTIHLESKINIQGNATIAGQTAPGDGICLADQSVQLSGDNIIVRFLRFRLGDKYQKGGMIDGNGADDAFGGVRRNNIIIDHCSMSWSTDEVFSIYAGDSMSIQWNLISEPLNYSYHFEKGDKDYEHHGFGAIWGGVHASFHHNLFAHCINRTPRFNGIRHTKEENVDFQNNVIYNWGNNNVYAGEGGNYNIVNNYYKPGPSTNKKALTNIAKPYKRDDIPFGKWFIHGNNVEGYPQVSNNNILGVKMEEGNDSDLINSMLKSPISVEKIGATDALTAYQEVLKFTGCIFPVRDTLDQRIINDVKNTTGRIIDVQGGYSHGTDYELTTNAWPTLKPGIALKDTDQDGLPDEWELKNKLNPNDSSDASKLTAGSHYTNIEVYINDLIKIF
jgi:pectate lyase